MLSSQRLLAGLGGDEAGQAGVEVEVEAERKHEGVENLKPSPVLMLVQQALEAVNEREAVLEQVREDRPGRPQIRDLRCQYWGQNENEKTTHGQSQR